MHDEYKKLGEHFDKVCSAGEPSFVHVPVDGLATAIIEPPGYVMEPLLPRGHVTLLGGHGGAGKSMLSLVCAAHVACGRAWGGFQVEESRTLFASLEDSGEWIRYRLRKIVEAYHLDSNKVAENFVLVDGSTNASTLAIERFQDGVRSIVFTPAMTELANLAKGCGLIVIDNASDAFGGDENVRSQVHSFLRRLTCLAQTHEAAVLLLAHVDKNAARSGSKANTYSGSTGWHNKVRSRLALITTVDGPELHHEKLNLGPTVEPLALTWQEGVLVRRLIDRVAERQRAQIQLDADAGSVLNVVRIAIANGDTIPASTSGPKQAHHVLENYSELPKSLRNATGRKKLKAALVHLQRKELLRKVAYRDPYRNNRERWELTQDTGTEMSVERANSALVNTPHTPQCELTHAGDCVSSGDGDETPTNAPLTQLTQK